MASVLAAIKDFEKIPNGTIVLVTDGIESCKGDIKSIAPAIKAAGLALEVNIVGFDIKEAAARQELQSIAASTGGRYLDAKDADELLSALGKTLKLEYIVIDARGKRSRQGSRRRRRDQAQGGRLHGARPARADADRGQGDGQAGRPDGPDAEEGGGRWALQ